MNFDDFLHRLADTARDRSDVVGLAAFGSTADRSRTDVWSDHDFAWITTPGAEDSYRHTRDWLPHPDRITAHVVEHHGGVKVIYDDGHLAEFGVASLDDFAQWEAARGAALVDTGGLAEVLEHLATAPRQPRDARAELLLATSAILVGVGRARRGEVLSGHSSVRSAAVQHLLRALAAPHPVPPQDVFDPHRRVELVHPELAAEVTEALEQPVDDAGRRLLDVVERLGHDDAEVQATVSAVRRRLWG